jgi:RNA polymerase sigma factor (sigma-70 family)
MPEVDHHDLVFADWYAISYGRIVAAIAISTGQEALARDAADEACARALAKWDRVGVMHSPTGWVVKVAYNHARRTLRREAMERSVLHRFRTSAKPETETVDGPAGDAWDLVRQLAPQQRTVITLRYVADLSENEIARVMGIRRGTVSAHHSAALQALRKLASSVSLNGRANE